MTIDTNKIRDGSKRRDDIVPSNLRRNMIFKAEKTPTEFLCYYTTTAYVFHVYEED